MTAHSTVELAADPADGRFVADVGGAESPAGEPAHVLARFDQQYGFAEAHTMAGKIGLKVWICKKDEAPAKETSHAAYA